MTFTTILILILIVQIIHFLGTWKLYKKAGRKFGKLRCLFTMRLF